MKGFGRLYKRGNLWWCEYGYQGQYHRESTGETDEAAARAYLRKRRDQLGADRLGLKKFVAPAEERVFVKDLLSDLERDFKLREMKSLAQSVSHVKRAKQAFGRYQARAITPQVIDSWYQQQKAKGEIEISTMNRTVAMLRQALQLALERGQLPTLPRIRKLSELGRERKGFFEKSEVEAVIENLPDYLKDFARFGYLTGWRKGEISSLEWKDVDPDAKVIRLRPEHSKNATGRVLALEGELWAIIERRMDCRPVQRETGPILSTFLFHLDGNPIGDFRKAWKTACKAAGIQGRMFHDFRRSAVRNMVRAGVPERVAMSISGHKTRAIFDRYSIVSEDDLREAQAKLQRHLGKQPIKKKVVEMGS